MVRLSLVVVLIGTCLWMVVASGEAATITRTYLFSASEFGAGAPTDPVSGSVTVTFDPTVNNFNLPVDAISLTIAGHTYTVAEVGAIFSSGSNGVFLIGGRVTGILGIDAFTDDFIFIIRQATTPTPRFDSFEYATSTTTIYSTDHGSVTLGASCPSTFDFDFSGTEYTDCFRDVLRDGDINDGTDVGGTNHDSLNFTGGAGSGGATWLTVYDATPGTPAPGPTFAAETLCADVLFHTFNNVKGAGLVALLNEGVDKRGLALVVSDAGNTDRLRLATVEGDPAKLGTLTFLTSVSLGAGIAENVWYRLVMTVTPTTPTVTGKVFKHSDPQDPNSGLGAQVGATLTYPTPTDPAALPDGVTSPGQNGILAQAVSTRVDLSVTNFSNDATRCAP
jgi:hypothetical protein